MCVGCVVVDLGGGGGGGVGSCASGGVGVGGCCAGSSGAGWFGGWAGLHHAAGEGQGRLGGMDRHGRPQPLQLPVRVLDLLLESVKHLRETDTHKRGLENLQNSASSLSVIGDFCRTAHLRQVRDRYSTCATPCAQQICVVL